MKAVVALVAVSLLGLGGCVTTTTGGLGGEKWDSSERAALHTRLGVNYLQQGQLEVAREELDLALRIEPNSSDANLAMAKLQLRLDSPRDAHVHFQRAVRNNPESVGARNDFGFFLCNQGDYADGLAQFNAALNNPLNNAQYVTLYGAAECERQAGNLEQAVASYELALRLQPDMRQALMRLAVINFDQGEYFTARAYLERFFQDRFYTADSLYLAVRNELALNRRDLAGEYARLLRERFPGSSHIDALGALFRESTG